MPPSALIFDFNGVLVDDEPVHCELFQSVLRDQGLPLTREDYFQRYFVFDDASVFRQIFADAGRALNEPGVRALCDQKAARYAALPSSSFRYYEGAESLARDASRSVPVGIASGARAAEIRRHLELRGLKATFRAVVSIDDVSKGKPDPEPFLEAARRLGVTATGCVAIEDSPGGIASARAAGMRVVAVTHSVARDRLQADVVLDTLAGTTWEGLKEQLNRIQ
ncbi:MAG: phosphatase/phosphohexomutase-like [Planctomycetota bacterium]|nr:MAG: phosphatase/phosphohexomutase-like [Planctomycetota bacterium]